MDANVNTDARAPLSPYYDELLGDMPMDIVEDELPRNYNLVFAILYLYIMDLF